MRNAVHSRLTVPHAQKKNRDINWRVSPKVKAIAKAEAKVAHRSITSWIETLILAARTKRQMKEWADDKKRHDLHRQVEDHKWRDEGLRRVAAREAEGKATADAAGFQVRLAAEKAR